MNGGKLIRRLPLALSIVGIFGVLATLVFSYVMEEDFSDTASISLEGTRDGKSYCVKFYSSTSGKSEMKAENCGEESVMVKPTGLEPVKVDPGAEAVITEVSVDIFSTKDLWLGSASLGATSSPV